MEEKRIERLGVCMKTFAEVDRQVLPIVGKCLDGMTKAAESIEPKTVSLQSVIYVDTCTHAWRHMGILFTQADCHSHAPPLGISKFSFCCFGGICHLIYPTWRSSSMSKRLWGNKRAKYTVTFNTQCSSHIKISYGFLLPKNRPGTPPH